ncbi:MAG: Ig-like domain-containing protein [Anaerolineae bacterium]|nr:Ig-like domain-containing protein [Anaerolineae bacterium]
MHKPSSRCLWATCLILIMLGLAGCEQVINLPTTTSTPAPEPTATATAIPTATPVMPEGPYPPVLLDYEPRSGQEVAAYTTPSAVENAAVIKLSFDQPMDQASVVAALQVTPILEGDFEWPDDATFVFRPHSLVASTRYRVTLVGDVRSAAGLPLSIELSFAFSTLTPLEVTHLTPATGSVDARVDAPALIVFNRAVVPLTCVGQPAQADSECPALPLGFEPAVLGTGVWVETSVYRFDAVRGWAAGRAYTATLEADIESIEGAALQDPVSWSFSTASPAIQAGVPADGQSQVPLETDIRVIFNTPMDQEITGSVFGITDEAGDVMPGAITWEDNGAVLVFTPATRLSLGTRYTVQVGARARAATSAPLENPQIWTFSTVSYPALVASLPQDGATDVDTAEPVRLAFSGMLNAAMLDRRIIITPAVENPYTYFDAAANVYQLSWDKQPQTEYCVQLKPGIADVYSNVITESQTACFVTGDLPSFISPASAGSAVTLDASQPSELFFLVQNLDRVAFTLSEVSESDFVRKEAVGGVVIREWQETFTVPRNTATVAPLVLRRLGGALPTGYYHLAWEDLSWGAQSLNFAVVDRHVTLKLAAEEALVWVTDLRSGEPVTRTAVSLVGRDGLLIAGGTTDEDGLALIPISPREDLWENVVAVVGEPGGEGFGAALTSWVGEAAPSAFGIALDGSPTASHVIRTYTDQTVYGTSETVRFRGILREDADRYLMPSLDLPVQVALREAGGRSLYTTTVALSDMGTFSGTLTLPENVGVGDYVLEASLPDFSDNRPGTATFTIAIPRETKLTISVAPETTNVLAGDPVRAVIAVDDVFGIPAAGVRVTWTVYAQGKPLPAVSSEVWQWPEVVSGEPVLVAGGGAVTDADGRFALELPAEMPLLAEDQALGPQRWIIEAVVCDALSNDACVLPASGQAQVVVHPSRFYLGMQPREWVVRAGMRNEINLLALDWTQNPIAEQEIAVSLTQREWFRIPAAYPIDSPTWGYTDTVVSTARVTTNFEGQALAALVPPNSGTYIVAADTLDADGHPTYAEIMLWASGSEAASWPVGTGEVTPVADAHLYHVGDRAKVLLPVSFDGPYQMLMTVERNGILEVERQVLDTVNPVVEIPIVEAFVPNVYVSFVLVHGVTETTSAPEVRAGYVTLNVAPTAQTLTITAQPDKTAYRPGDAVTLTVQAVDAAGHPADATVGVALVDKSLLSIEERGSLRNVLSIVDVFYGTRPLRVMTGDGLLVLSHHQDATTLAEKAAYHIARFADGEVLTQTPGEFFPTTVLWEGDKRTDTDGETYLTFELPDTPATWVAGVYALTADTKVGEAEIEIVATQPLRIQPEPPRFLVVGDQAEVAALIYNHTDEPFAGAVQLLVSTGARVDTLIRTFDLPAGGHTRVVWTLSVEQSSAKNLGLAFSAAGGGYHDEISVEVPLYRYVMPDVIGTAGVLDGDGVRLETLHIPPEAGDASALIARVVSSPVGALVDTLTYLDQYPYANTDVLIERFVANVFTYRALQELDVADGALLERLQVSIAQALERLYARQNADGGWGWWEGESTIHLTAFAALGLVKAERAGFDVRQIARERALEYIYDNLVLVQGDEMHYPEQALGLYVLSDAGVSWPTGAGAVLYTARESLGVVGRAYLALALGTSDPSDSRLLALLDGLRTEAKLTAAGAHWEGTGDSMTGNGSDLYWNTDVVVTAIAVDALARFAPEDSSLLAQAARWLMVTRRGGRWQTTYETAWAIGALSDVLRASGDPATLREASRYDWSVVLNGSVLTESTAQADVLDGEVVDVPWRLRAGLLEEGREGEETLPVLFRDRPNVLEISRGSGAGLLYYTAHLELSAPVTQIRAESRGLMLRREYCAVEDDTATNGVIAPMACRPLTELHVGDQVTVRLTLIAPQTRAYVRLEVPHPAGLVPVNTVSSNDTFTATMEGCILKQGASADLRAWWTVPFERCEVLDDRVVFFASEVEVGTYQMTYILRAVAPGDYGALPAVASEVYFPEVWGRSAGDVLHVVPQTQD